LALPADALFDDAATEIGVDEPAFGAVYRLDQSLVAYGLALGETREAARRENLHASLDTMDYNTMYYRKQAQRAPSRRGSMMH